MNIVTFPLRRQAPYTKYRDTSPVEIYAGRSLEGIRESLSADQKHEFTFLKFLGQEGDAYYEYHIALKGFMVYDSLRPSSSVGPEEYQKSGALYPAEYQEEGRIFLLQYLPPGSHTSCHDHDNPVVETYYGILGEAMLLTRGINDVQPEPHHIHLRQEDMHRLTSGVTHQLRTNDTFCLSLLEIIGHRGTLDTLVHNYQDWDANTPAKIL